MRKQIAGVENAGVEVAGVIMRRNPSEEIVRYHKIPVVKLK